MIGAAFALAFAALLGLNSAIAQRFAALAVTQLVCPEIKELAPDQQDHDQHADRRDAAYD